MLINKYHAIYKLNNRNILIAFLLLVLFTLILTSFMYGIVPIHSEISVSITSNNNNNKNNNIEKRINLNNVDMYKLIFQQNLPSHVKNENSISVYEKKEIEELLNSVKKTRASIIKSINFEDANKIKKFKERQLVLRKMVEEKLNSTQPEDEDEDSDDKIENFMKRVREFILTNTSEVMVVDRRLMIDYLKLDKFKMIDRLKSVKSVKKIIEENHDLR
jgi:hypothetical protein